MKLLLAILAFFMAGCLNSGPRPARVIRVDTVSVVVTDTLKLPTRCDSLQRINDSLRARLFLANYKVEKVRFYLNICLKKPSQDKFLKGWIKRAIQ